MTVVVTGEFRLPIAKRDAARDAMARIIAASRAEPGCLAYAYAEDVLEPGLYRVHEIWTDRAALAAHFEAPHMRQWQAERAELGMTDRRVACHTAADAENL